MFASIQNRAAHDMGALLVQMPEALGDVVLKLQNRKTVAEVLGNLDVNGDGSVTLREALTTRGRSAVDAMLPYIEQQMQVGAGGENIDFTGGVTVATLASAFAPINLDGFITDGTSHGPNSQIPDVQFAGFCDGSVRPVGSLTPTPFTHWSLYSQLQAVSSDPGNTGWTGGLTLVNGDGSSVNGMLIGLLLPAVQGQGRSLNGFFVTLGGVGTLAGAPGTGPISVNWGDDLDGFFSASLSSKAFVRALPAVQ
jgi:hypothetical protein